MGAITGDILVDISDEDLPKLAEIYEKHKNWAPHAYSAIKTGIEWRQKSENRYMTFMSPNNCWKEDGRFFLLLHYYAYDLFIFTLDESGKNVYEGLIKTKRLDTSYSDRSPLLFCIHNKLYPTVLNAMKLRKAEIIMEGPCHMYSIPKEEALKFEIECSSDVYIKELDTSHASIVNQNWIHKYENSEKFAALLISMNDAYGIFLKSNDELVSWILLSMLGQLSHLQTKEGHKKKGYASLITKYTLKKLAERGHNPFGTILLQNTASWKMFKKIGFRDLGIATSTYYKNQ